MFDQHFARDAAGRLIVTAYIDGACSGNPGPGGYGVVILDQNGNAHSLSGYGGPQTTNNKMELSVAIALLDYFGSEKCSFTIHADSHSRGDPVLRYRKPARRPVSATAEADLDPTERLLE